MSKALTTRQARRAIASDDDAKREAVMNELEALAASEITDVIRWAPDGTVVVTGSDQLSSRARKAIKKVKVTPTQHGNAIEVEMHDKISALRLTAKVRGMLDNGIDDHRPSVIGINLKGPSTTTYEDVNDGEVKGTAEAAEAAEVEAESPPAPAEPSEEPRP